MKEATLEIIRPNDKEILRAAKAIMEHTLVFGGANVYTDGDGNIGVVQTNSWLEGWDSLGMISGATVRMAAKRIREALDGYFAQ